MTSHDLTFATADDVILAGTLQLPDGAGPHPAALLLVGSGDVDRDSDHRKLALGVTRELADALAGSGLASLRHDKRGVGASGGTYLTITFADARADASAALTALREHPSVDAERILVIGNSEGALHAISLAAADPRLAGVGLLAGTATAGEATMHRQAERIVPTLPVLVRGLLGVLRQTPARAQTKLFAKVRSTETVVLRMQGRRLNAGWLRGFIDHDPAPELARLTIPVFALTGDQDLQVDPDDLERIAALVTKAPVETHRVPQLNHILRKTEGGGSPMTEYRRQIKTGQPLDPTVLDTLTTWAATRTATPI